MKTVMSLVLWAAALILPAVALEATAALKEQAEEQEEAIAALATFDPDRSLLEQEQTMERYANKRRSNGWFASPATLDWMQSIAQHLDGPATAEHSAIRHVADSASLVDIAHSRQRHPMAPASGGPDMARAGFSQGVPIVRELEQESFLQVASHVDSVTKSGPVGDLSSGKVAKLAATVSDMGLVQSQILASTIIMGLLILFLLIDRGYQRMERQQEKKDEKIKEQDWLKRLASFETRLPGISGVDDASPAGIQFDGMERLALEA